MTNKQTSAEIVRSCRCAFNATYRLTDVLWKSQKCPTITGMF